jgi:hypothetical protein
MWGPNGDAGERRYPVPSNRAISQMDEVYGWLARVEDTRLRILVGRRSLVRPDSLPEKPRYLWPWTRLCEADGHVKSGPNVELLRQRWIAGVDQIVRRIAGLGANDNTFRLRPAKNLSNCGGHFLSV